MLISANFHNNHGSRYHHFHFPDEEIKVRLDWIKSLIPNLGCTLQLFGNLLKVLVPSRQP